MNRSLAFWKTFHFICFFRNFESWNFTTTKLFRSNIWKGETALNLLREHWLEILSLNMVSFASYRHTHTSAFAIIVVRLLSLFCLGWKTWPCSIFNIISSTALAMDCGVSWDSEPFDSTTIGFFDSTPRNCRLVCSWLRSTSATII